MRLRGTRTSSNIEDRRRSGGGGRVIGGGLGIGGVLLVLAIGWFTGIDVTPILNGGSEPQGQQTTRELSAQEEQSGVFVSQVLASTEDVWGEVFPQQVGEAYQPPRLVMFSQVTSSPCGGASGATGPFYCPLDQKAYLDTDFFSTLSQQLGAEGDFAAAYVIAHEVAHHVQKQLGILDQVDSYRQGVSKAEGNAATVRLELQADCLAGVWASNVDALLEPGDIDEAVNAARMIGDDRLQRQAGQVPQPHTFTHGTSEQRSRWFTTGYETGEIGSCDTFNAKTL